MTALFLRIFGRLPIGWLQLRHNPGRLAAAVAGVAFANILVFMQIGFMGALVATIRMPYLAMNADVLVSSADMNALADGGPVPRQRMFEALATPGVAGATALLFGKIDWKQPDGTIRTLDVFGVDPAAQPFRAREIDSQLWKLMVADAALLDRGVRNGDPRPFEALARGETFRFEAKNRTLEVVGAFTIGGGFSADGYLIVSDQTFLRLFPQRVSGAPNQILVRVAGGLDAEEVAARLRAALPSVDAQARIVAAAAARDQRFQTTQRPVGLVFGFGIVIGVLVGLIIVYQVLSTDVADHLREYATFKAIGYPARFFLGVVFEEATILAALGFAPGLAISLGLYAAVSRAAGLPLEMSVERAAAVFVGTLLMCAASGALATRRLARADPADLF